MPIFDYHCADCDATVEVFVRGSAAPRCPECRGRRIQKLVSAFAVGGAGAAGDDARRMPPESDGGCGSCGDPRGPGACQLD